MGLLGKVVIVTGAGAGIGANAAKLLASHGAKVAIVARSTDMIHAVKAECVGKGAKEDDVLCITASVAEKEDIPRIIKETVQQFGKIDHLVNNAGLYAFADLEHLTVDLFDLVMNTNLRAPMFLAKEALPYLKKTKGSVVNISSTTSNHAAYWKFSYTISKGALNHFTRCLALQVATDGVRVNTIQPGFVLTDTMLSAFPEENRAEMQEILAKHGIETQPLGGAVRMSQVSKVIHFLLSDAASAVTGESIAVDNGHHIMTPQNMDPPELFNTGLAATESKQKNRNNTK